MNADVTARAVSTVMHVRCPDRVPEETYRQVLELLAGLSSVLQALPPSAVLVGLRGALKYHRVDARLLGEILRIRTISRLGVDVRVGIGRPSPSRRPRLLRSPGPAACWPSTRTVSPSGWGPRRCRPCMGSAPARRRCCRNTASTASVCSPLSPPATVQRLLGGRAGRTVAAYRSTGLSGRTRVLVG
ncbi:hypothetical protein ACIPSA_36715 [Streptomyces sp. NPDC086549]|uniref:hypothetical protein n=1 Tax=Streptomyces sp. NPDC086549 TaxID=3365752 RepID=UPI00380C0269